jgi:hypothetical protein
MENTVGVNVKKREALLECLRLKDRVAKVRQVAALQRIAKVIE